MSKHTKSWMAPSQRERKNKHGATEAAGVYGNSDHLDAKGLWDDPLMAQGLAWKMHTEARDEKTSDWLQAIHKTAEQKGLAPTTPKHPSMAKGNDVVGQKRQQTRDRYKMVQQQNWMEYEQERKEMTTEIGIVEGHDIKEKMLRERRDWVAEQKALFGKIPAKLDGFHNRFNE